MKNGKSPFLTPERFSGKKLTEMTLQEVFAYQQLLNDETKRAGYGIRNGRVVGTSAVGRGQFVGDTLKRSLSKLGITDFAHTKFTPRLQDQLIIQNAKSVGLDLNQVEKWGPAEKIKLGLQWESLDTNKGKITPQDLDWMIARIRVQTPERP